MICYALPVLFKTLHFLPSPERMFLFGDPPILEKEGRLNKNCVYGCCVENDIARKNEKRVMDLCSC